MKQARRNFLLLGTGAAAGTMLSPAPWKLLDDVSIWSQNWSWIPRPLRGEIKTRHSVCTLCPMACGVRARCTGDQPVAVAGVPQHPVSAGKLCAMGVGAHQLPYHPLRAGSAADGASKRVADLLASSSRAVLLDLYPRRAASAVYARLNLTYTTLTRPETATARACGDRAGFDVAKAQSVVSFGAPVLERWGPVLAAWSSAARPKVIQVEPALSRTASLADIWIPVRAGSEGAAARALLGMMPANVAATHCGVAPELLEQAARMLRENPTMAISAGHLSRDDEQAVAALNRQSPALVQRAASPVNTPPATSFEALPDGSIELLLIDHGPVAASPGWDMIARKLAMNGTVVSFSPYKAGDAARAHILVPSPAWLEVLDDAVEPEDSAVPYYTVGAALLPRPEGVLDPVDVLTGAAGAREQEMKARTAAIHKHGQGEVFAFADASRTPVKDFESADKLWEKLCEGACWFGGPPSELRLAGGPAGEYAAPARASAAAPPALLPNAGVLPPLACKLTQESRLYTRSV